MSPFLKQKRYWETHSNWYLEFVKFPNEIFKPVKGYDGFYFISNYGQVVTFHCKRPFVLKYNFHSRYFGTILILNTLSQFYLIHNLVYITFAGQIPNGHYIIHKNGILTDNHIANLALVKVSKPEKQVDILTHLKAGRFLLHQAANANLSTG
jgi:hypothetical protein